MWALIPAASHCIFDTVLKEFPNRHSYEVGRIVHNSYNNINYAQLS